MRTVETTGKTPEEAIEAALDQLGAGRDEVEIDVVSEGRGGLAWHWQRAGGRPCYGLPEAEQASPLRR